MNVVKFPEVDTIAVADGCFDLPMCQAVSGEDQIPTLISCWELSDEEMEVIKKTRRVWLRILAVHTPPVNVDVFNPFETYSDIIPLKKLFAESGKVTE
jgi:hypothetical protein